MKNYKIFKTVKYSNIKFLKIKKKYKNWKISIHWHTVFYQELRTYEKVQKKQTSFAHKGIVLR